MVHCDLNEFNLIVEQNTSAVTLIDFPQMISTKHPNAAMYFERDVRGLVKFFTMKLKFDVERRASSTSRGVRLGGGDALRYGVPGVGL